MQVPGVRRQILAISIVPLVFLLVLLAIGFYLRSLTLESTELARRSSDALAKADRAYELVGDATRSLQVYLRDHNPDGLRTYRETEAKKAGRLADVIAAAGPSPSAQARARRYTGDIAKLFDIVDRYLALRLAGKLAAAEAVRTAPGVPDLGRELLAAKSRLDEGVRNEAGARLRDLRRRLTALGTALVVVTVTGIAVTLWLGALLGLRTVRRLRQLAENAERLGRREPTVPITGRDEIADVDRATHELAERLEESMALQIALLPNALPAIQGLRLDSVYVPAASQTKVGGDWFDVFEISGNVVGISLGDVAGHGLRAAATMASLRQAIRIAARLEPQPSRVLRHVNQTFCSDEPGALATAIFATFETTTGTLRWSVAGHPPPILIRPGDGLTLLEGKGLVLGIDPRCAFDDFVARLDVGCALVLYTDGLIEVERDYSKACGTCSPPSSRHTTTWRRTSRTVSSAGSFTTSSRATMRRCSLSA